MPSASGTAGRSDSPDIRPFPAKAGNQPACTFYQQPLWGWDNLCAHFFCNCNHRCKLPDRLPAAKTLPRLPRVHRSDRFCHDPVRIDGKFCAAKLFTPSIRIVLLPAPSIFAPAPFKSGTAKRPPVPLHNLSALFLPLHRPRIKSHSASHRRSKTENGSVRRSVALQIPSKNCHPPALSDNRSAQRLSDANRSGGRRDTAAGSQKDACPSRPKSAPVSTMEERIRTTSSAGSLLCSAPEASTQIS